MIIPLTNARFCELVAATSGPSLAGSEIRAIIATMQLSASIDLDDTHEQQALLDDLKRQLCELVDIPADTIEPLSPVPIDDEERAARIAQLAAGLTSPGARELAYVLANIMIVEDQELAPIESTLLQELQAALAISPERSAELLELGSRAITPGSADEAGGRVASAQSER